MKYYNQFKQTDALKTKVLKYVLYKKRTEQEIRNKFIEEDSNIFELVLEDLKEKGYINDVEYIEKSINEFMLLNTLSIKEIYYKLQQKGIDKNLIEDYISKNKENLLEYEQKSAEKIYNKKIKTMENIKIKEYLLRKGYNFDIVEDILESGEF